MSTLQAQSTNPFELVSEKDSIQVNDTLQTLESIMPAVDSIAREQPIKEELSNIPLKPSNPFNLVNKSDSIETEMSSSVTNSAAIPIETTDENTRTKLSETIRETVSARESTPIPTTDRNNFVFWISLISCLLLAIAFNSNRNIISDIGKSVQNLNFMKLLQKEESNGWSVAYILLSIIYILNVAIFIRFACIYFELPLLGYNYVKILILIIGLMIMRHISLYIISYLRKRLVEVINYSFIIITINAILGLILVPINLIVAFGPNMLVKNVIIIGLIIIILANILRWFRGFINSLRIIVSDSFHFLLYLCTCEIVPITIFIGFARNLIN